MTSLRSRFALAGRDLPPTFWFLWFGTIISRLGGFEPAVHLRLKLCFSLLHALVAHCLVLRRIRLDLGPVERDVPKLHQAGLLGKLQNLHEQAGQRLQVPLAEL